MYHLLREQRLRKRAAAQPQRGGQRRTIAGPPRASGDAARAASSEGPVAALPAAGPPHFFPPAESEQQASSRAQALMEFVGYYNESVHRGCELKGLSTVSDCLDEQEEAERLLEVARGDREFDADDVSTMLVFYDLGW